MVPISTFWTGRCIWMRIRPTSTSAMCLTAKTGMGSCVPSRKRRWKNWALNCLIRVSQRANTTTENRLLMQYAGRCSLTSAANMGVHLEQEPSYGGRAYLEKQDYILMKQKEQLAAQEQKLEELTLKIEDVETLVEEVSDIAYDKAVEVVTDTVRLETHKEDLRLVEETKNWVLSPERKAPQKEREYTAARLDGVISKIKNAMQSALSKIQKKLMQPEVKQAGKQQIQEKAKESILAFLKKAKQDSAQRESNRKKQQEKQDMEL